MTQDEIIRMAREASLITDFKDGSVDWTEEQLHQIARFERFAALVRSAAFDEAARIAEGNFSRDGITQGELSAAAIRGSK